MSRIEALHAECFSGLSHVAHGFFTRRGGVSGGIYAGLNCGTGSRDKAEHVAQNRIAVTRSLELRADNLSTLYQIHSASVVTLVAMPPENQRPQADGQVTSLAGLGLGILAADCAPILFADLQKPVIGAAHAGWRGAAAGVAEATLREMERLGATKSTIVAAIGPCISQAAYEVGADMRTAVLAQDANADVFFEPRPANHFLFDLSGYLADRLKRAGLAVVEILGPCTYADEERFFSYRRSTHRCEPDYGRHISVICLRG
jgi:YfiH family protein